MKRRTKLENTDAHTQGAFNKHQLLSVGRPESPAGSGGQNDSYRSGRDVNKSSLPQVGGKRTCLKESVGSLSTEPVVGPAGSFCWMDEATRQRTLTYLTKQQQIMKTTSS